MISLERFKELYSTTSSRFATVATLTGALLLPIDMRYGLLLLNYAAIQHQISKEPEFRFVN